MSREKQIEEIAKDLCNSTMCDLETYNSCRKSRGNCSRCQRVAEDLYNAGYRKQSENMVEVFCKVGDTVYQTDGIRIYELEVFDVSLRKGKPYYETESIDFDNTAIGKSIFLTKEEAEAKMKGGAE